MPQWLSKHLSDPGWWFTAIFIALAVNILSPFVSRGIAKSLASVSHRYRKRKERLDAKADTEARLLSKDGALMVFEASRALGVAGLVCIAQVLCFQLIILGVIIKGETMQAVGYISSLLSTFGTWYFVGKFRPIKLAARMRREAAEAGQAQAPNPP